MRFKDGLYDVVLRALSNTHALLRLSQLKVAGHTKYRRISPKKARGLPGNGRLRAANNKCNFAPLQKRKRVGTAGPRAATSNAPAGFKYRAVDGRDEKCGWRAFAMRVGMRVANFFQHALLRAANTTHFPAHVAARWNQASVDTAPRPLDIEDMWWLARLFHTELPGGILIYSCTDRDWIHVKASHNIFVPRINHTEEMTKLVSGFGASAPVAFVPCLSPQRSHI